MMNTYTISYTEKAPNWNVLEKAALDCRLWGYPTDVAAYGQLAYGPDRLYVHLHADERQQRAENRGLLDQPCEDSCLEFFFRPVAEDPRYLNIEMNPNRCLYLGIGTGRDDLTRLLPPGGADQLHAHVERSEAHWDLYYELPYALLRLFFPDFTPSGTITGNFYHCGDLTVQEHYLSWNPLTCPDPDFHRPEYFGQLHFEAK